jgi:hypothetical protein
VAIFFLATDGCVEDLSRADRLEQGPNMFADWGFPQRSNLTRTIKTHPVGKDASIAGEKKRGLSFVFRGKHFIGVAHD